jgi:aminoglycoside phosphotransferase (APT) family kinase protein
MTCQNPVMQALAEAFARYAQHRLPDASDFSVTGIQRIHGGASRETYRLALEFHRDGQAHSQRLILRRDPEGSLIETERATEFQAYQAFQSSDVPVPEILWLEEDTSWLERPFFVMREVSDCESSPQVILLPPYAEHVAHMGQQKWSILGAISRADPEDLGLTKHLERVAPDACWRRELAHWEGVLDEDELQPQPIGRAAIRWLRRHPPPPAQKLCVVHGDYRTGNFLVDREGTIRAVLDWEMTHLGDPLEDLAWSLNRTWCWARDERPGGLLPRPEAIRIWEEASGLAAPAPALHWWELFSSVKALGIWISSAKEFATGRNHDPVLGFTSWWLPNSQDRAILETMGHLA